MMLTTSDLRWMDQQRRRVAPQPAAGMALQGAVTAAATMPDEAACVAAPGGTAPSP